MAYITEQKLSNMVDIPITLAATQLTMGDWMVIGSVEIQAPMRLICRVLNLQIMSSSVAISNISPSNLVYGNLGLVYVSLQQNYTSGSPGGITGLDSVIATSLGLSARDPTAPVFITTPGTYSWVIANNMQPDLVDSVPLIAPSTSIDFVASVIGTVRLELSYL